VCSPHTTHHRRPIHQNDHAIQETILIYRKLPREEAVNLRHIENARGSITGKAISVSWVGYTGALVCEGLAVFCSISDRSMSSAT
jgi:hypothetical protein